MLILQGEDHQVTTASWALRPPIPRSHIWRNGGGSGGELWLVPRAKAVMKGAQGGG